MSLGNVYNSYGEGGKLLYSGNDAQQYQKTIGGSSGVAGLQNTGVSGINTIKMPDWLNQNPDSQLGELLQTYGGIGSNFDPTGQVQARNDAIGYNTSAGTQAANNAATEYSNRAAQSGASQLGAGVVKAQAMLPVLSQNASLKTQAADVAAKAHQDAAGLAAQIASTIGNLRTSYLSTLTGYAQGQQQMQTQNSQFNASLGMDQQRLNFEREQTYQQQQAQDRARQLALAQTSQRTIAPKAPIGNYTTWNMGAGSYGGYGETANDRYAAAANQQLRGMF